MSDIQKILVPDVGGDEVEIIEICVAVGDSIDAEDAIITVETDKASMDIPAPSAGTITQLTVAVGDKLKEGDLIAEMSAGSTTTAAAETAPVEAPVVATPTAAPATSTNSVINVEVPDIGEDGEVDIIEILVAVGDVIEAEDGLITLETDKATMDVPTPTAGTVKSILVNVGDKVKQGSLVITLETTSGAVAEVPTEVSVATPVAEVTPAAAVVETVSAIIDVEVPDIGEDGEVDVIEILVAVGDVIEAEDGLITLETDKATMDVPTPTAGTVKEIFVSAGDKVKQGSLVIKLETLSSGTVAPVATPAPVAAPTAAPAKASVAASSAPVASTSASGGIYTSPSIRRLAREFGVDLALVKGSGRKGRIVKEDVQAFVKAELAKPKATADSSTSGNDNSLQVVSRKAVDFSKFGEIETVPLNRIQKISGPSLHRNWVTIPHVTQFDEADITEVEAFRKAENVICEKQKLGFKITPLVFILKAIASAMAAYPVFNSSLSEDGESIIMKKYCHIGVAVDTPNGLVVPVVRDVDKKGIHQLSQELVEISLKARDGKLKATDMQGSCFTISSLGGIGGTAFTPIVNAPDVAILGVSKSEMKPKWNGSEFIPRLMLPLSLSYDHRVIDGAVAARFIVHLSAVMTDIRKLVL